MLAKWLFKWNTCSLSIWDLIRDRELGTACVLTGKLEYVSLTSSADIGRTSSGSASAKGGQGTDYFERLRAPRFPRQLNSNTWQKSDTTPRRQATLRFEVQRGCVTRKLV